jgi:glycosyltransferase involved in cell wall biosynthesis
VPRALAIVHCLRAPLGGLFRHVCDLASASIDRGHRVGIVCDSASTSDADDMLEELRPRCALGLHRIPMRRAVGPWDMATALRVVRAVPRADILHGHGAKGGAYARLAAAAVSWSRGTRVVYTPHGGALHEDPKRPRGRVYFAVERVLAKLTDGLVFTSEFEARAYRRLVGAPACPTRVVHNGVSERDFEPLEAASAATDFVFIGELRHLKGLDLLLHALVDVDATAAIVGSGPDEDELRRLASRLHLHDRVTFLGRLPARDAFTRGRCLVMPSRAESLPYIVLEAAAAGVPLIASDVGGIPEIIGSLPIPLVPPNDVAALRGSLREFLDRPQTFVARAESLRTRMRSSFRVDAMTDAILEFYRSIGQRSADARAGIWRSHESR